MKKIATLVILLVVSVCMLTILTGCGSKKNDSNDSKEESSVNTANLKTDYLKSDDGVKVEFYIPEGFEETEFYNKSDKWKGYSKDSASVDLKLVTKARAESIKKQLLANNHKEEEYIVNNKTFTKLSKEASVTYLYKVNDDTYYAVSSLMGGLTKNQMDTFLTIKD